MNEPAGLERRLVSAASPERRFTLCLSDAWPFDESSHARALICGIVHIIGGKEGFRDVCGRSLPGTFARSNNHSHDREQTSPKYICREGFGTGVIFADAHRELAFCQYVPSL